MLKISKINGRVWLKVFNETGLLYSDGDFDNLRDAMATAGYYLN